MISKTSDLPPLASGRTRIIFNPAAGKARSAGTRQAMESTVEWLRQQGVETDLATTERPNHARQLAAEAVAMGYETVVAAGGDGTINEVIQALACSSVALGVLPVGTVNIWASEISVPTNIERAREAFVRGQRRQIDLGLAGDRYFLLMAGIGFDAEVVRRVEQGSLTRWGSKLLDYAFTVVSLGASWQSAQMWIEQGGKTRVRKGTTQALMAIIGNTRRYAGPFSFTNQALVDDGLLDCVVLEDGNLLRRLGVFGRALLHSKTLRFDRADSVYVTSEPPLLVQVDGELIGTLPMTFSVAPRALTVITPIKGRHQLFGTSSAGVPLLAVPRTDDY